MQQQQEQQQQQPLRQPGATFNQRDNNNGSQRLMVQHKREQMTRCYDCSESCGNINSGSNGKRSSTGGHAIWNSILCTIIFALVLICIYLLYLVVLAPAKAPNDNNDQEEAMGPDGKLLVPAGSKLLLVSVFSRHGDRAPTDDSPFGEDMAAKVNDFWPGGLGNLTHTGRFRMFRLGLELRRRYANFLDFKASNYLAFSSRKPRCQESLELMLRGIFQLDWTAGEGLKLLQELSSTKNANSSRTYLPDGPGSPSEYQQVTIDTRTVPSLSMGPTLFPCKYQVEHPGESCEGDNATTRATIYALKGVKELEKILADKYKFPVGSNTSLGNFLEICGTVSCELQLRRTSTSFAYGRHYHDWVNKHVAGYTDPNVNLFELCDQVAALYADRCLTGTSDRLQLSPLVTSLITSQEVALGRAQASPLSNATSNNLNKRDNLKFDSSELFHSGDGQAKKVILYSSHDTVLQPLLYRLGIGRPNEDAHAFETRLARCRHSKSDTSKLLAGLGMSKFGLSYVFELYETSDKFAYVRMALYNEEDAKYKPVEYHRLDFGRICKQLFQEQNPLSGANSLDSFYKVHEAPSGATANSSSSDTTDLDCPFELFKNVTSKYQISASEFNKLCGM